MGTRTGRVLIAVEQTFVLAAPGTPILLNLETALGLTIVSRLPIYVVQVCRWSVEVTAGAAATTFSPALYDDGTGTNPFRIIDTMGTGIAVARLVRTPPAPVVFTAPGGILACTLSPNVAGDTFRVRAVVELLQ